MPHCYSRGSGFPRDPHPSYQRQHPGQPQTLMMTGGRPLPRPAPPPSPHLLDSGFAHDGAVQADSERGDGVHHQGQQDHEQDIGISQGVQAGICQCKKLVGDVGKVERTEGTTVGGQAPTHKGVEGSKEEMAPKL